MKNNILIHVPHSSLYIPEEYKRTALIPPDELDAENLFMCDTGIVKLIPPALEENAVIFPYSRLFCDVERFRDGSEPMGLTAWAMSIPATVLAGKCSGRRKATDSLYRLFTIAIMPR